MDITSFILAALAVLQTALGFRVVARLVRGSGTRWISEHQSQLDQKVSVVLPVLNERKRIERCVRSCMKQTEEVTEILVVDGGSNDGTQDMVRSLRRLDSRLRLIDASPIPNTWTGKAWGLHVGVELSSTESRWILCLDADVETKPNLTRSLVSHALETGVHAFSIATAQQLADRIDGILHPAMLTTLIYRFGPPGKAVTQSGRVQANGQCFFCRREVLFTTGAIPAARASLCEDITIARRIAAAGFPVGFYESENELVRTSMYADWRGTWDNWPRSLPMRDQYFGWREGTGLAEVALVQASAIPLFAIALLSRTSLWVVVATGAWVLLRLGILAGTRRAYPHRPWSYWLSPLADLPVVTKIIVNALLRHHSWRGRHYVRTAEGSFRVVEKGPGDSDARSA